MSVLERKTGTAKWFNPTKWDGFIELEVEKNKLARYSAIPVDGYRVFKQKEVVKFELDDGLKGIQAIAVIAASYTLSRRINKRDLLSFNFL